MSSSWCIEIRKWKFNFCSHTIFVGTVLVCEEHLLHVQIQLWLKLIKIKIKILQKTLVHSFVLHSFILPKKKKTHTNSMT